MSCKGVLKALLVLGGVAIAFIAIALCCFVRSTFFTVWMIAFIGALSAILASETMCCKLRTPLFLRSDREPRRKESWQRSKLQESMTGRGLAMHEYTLRRCGQLDF